MKQPEKQTDAQILENEIRGCVKFENFREELLHRNQGLDCMQVATAYRETPKPLTLRLGGNALTQTDYDKVDELMIPEEGLRDISPTASPCVAAPDLSGCCLSKLDASFLGSARQDSVVRKRTAGRGKYMGRVYVERNGIRGKIKPWSQVDAQHLERRVSCL